MHEQAKEKQAHRYRERIVGCQMGKGMRDGWKVWSDWEVQIASYNSSHEDVKYRIENTGNNIVITIYAAKWVLDLLAWWIFNHYSVHLKLT